MTLNTDTYLEFTDFSNLIRLEPIALIYPKAELDWDRNWINTKVTLKAGVFSGEFMADFLTIDFKSFKEQLVLLNDDFNATAAFGPMEHELVLKIKGDGIGHFEIDCQATPQHHPSERLKFSIDFDQTQIKNYIIQLERIITQFPVNGLKNS